LRSQTSLVAQDDSLLQGAIAENIAGFDEQIDMARVRECAALSALAIAHKGGVAWGVGRGAGAGNV
jgi:ABC-type bacteriocin/lantibiotic exporter with double-glycine peptidase domain